MSLKFCGINFSWLRSDPQNLQNVQSLRLYGTPQGFIYVNGTPVEEIREWYIANTGYVLQLALPYYEELTVRENLTLAAQLKLPKNYTLREKFERVEQVMEVVSLCTDVILTGDVS